MTEIDEDDESRRFGDRRRRQPVVRRRARASGIFGGRLERSGWKVLLEVSVGQGRGGQVVGQLDHVELGDAERGRITL